VVGQNLVDDVDSDTGVDESPDNERPCSRVESHVVLNGDLAKRDGHDTLTE